MIPKESRAIFEMLALYINDTPDFIDGKMIADITGGNDSLTEYAYGILLAAACGLDCYESREDKEYYRRFFPKAVKKLCVKDYENDPYLKTVPFKCGSFEGWSLEYQKYKPYELFVRDDPITEFDGTVIPQVGFFTKEFSFPAVTENGRVWMTVTPNEINTMKAPVAAARGRVLTYGLGLGYFAFMASNKDEVDEVVAVERDERVIKLFREKLLTGFPNKDKIRIVCADAFDYAESAMPKEGFDVVFTDIWHDPSDGVELYLRMKEYEKLCPDTEFHYWIEKSLRLYL